MAKVIFEFNEDEDRDTINIINNRYKLINALYELQSYRRNLYKGYINDTVLIDDKEKRQITDEEIEKAHLEGKFFEDAHEYLAVNDVIDKIDCILEDINYLIN